MGKISVNWHRVSSRTYRKKQVAKKCERMHEGIRISEELRKMVIGSSWEWGRGDGMGVRLSWYISLYGLIFKLYKCSTYSKHESKKMKKSKS